MIILTDPASDDENTFESYQKKTIDAFETILPDKCFFEKN